jgi:nucleotide-binding universal stress UspA family protein
LAQVQSSDGKVPITHRLELGDPASEILRVAEEIKCDLIVLGSHGRGAIARLLMGNVAEHVVRRATCPVLVVKSPIPDSTDS